MLKTLNHIPSFLRVEFKFKSKYQFQLVVQARRMLALFLEIFLFVTLAISIIYKYRHEKLEKNQKRFHKLPGPFSFPLIGGILQIIFLGNREHNYEALHKACKKYGKTMGFRGGIQEYVVTEDRVTIKEILTSPHWVNRFPSTPVYRQHTFGANLGLLFGEGKSWYETRRFTTRSLGENGFGELRTAQRILSIEVDAFIKHLNNLREQAGSIQVDGLFTAPTLNVSWTVVAGERFEIDDKELGILLKLLRKGSECEFALHPVFSFPIIRWIPGLSPLKKFENAFRAFYGQIKLMIEKRRNSGVTLGANKNLIDSFLQMIEKEKGNLRTTFTEQQLLVTVADLLAAAADTTSNSLSFALLYMVKYPDIQKRIQNEIDSTLGDLRPTVFDRPNLPYTEATMWEVLRVTNVLPILLRTSTCDTTVAGYSVKAGTISVCNVYQMHHDPEIWGDPENFRPDRFLGSDGKIIRDHGLLNFGAGKRSCLGQTVGVLSMFTFFSSVLQKYEVVADEAQLNPSLEPISGFTNSPRPFLAKFNIRKGSDSS